ncbi:MAG: ABC transporter permease [Neomegalonema sp.]
MKRFRRIFWLGLKELASLRRDRVMLGLLIYAFTVAVFIEATGTSTSVNNASIGFVDEDRSSLSRSIANAFFPPEFQPVEYLSVEDVAAALDGGRFLFVVGVPPGCEADLRAGRQPQAQVLIDATAMEQAGIGANYILEIMTAEIKRFAERRDLQTASPVDLVIHSAFNPNRDTTRFMSVIALVNQVTIMAMVLTGAAVMREREHGTIEQLLAMPRAPFDIAAAKTLANAGIVLSAAALSMVLIVEGALDVSVSGSRTLFLLGAALYLLSAAALGVFLATISRSMAQYGLLTILTIMAIMLLSGGATPVEAQPDWLQAITQVLPSRHFIASSQASIFKGAGIGSVWPQFAAVAALGLALLSGSLVLFRRSLGTDR